MALYFENESRRVGGFVGFKSFCIKSLVIGCSALLISCQGKNAELKPVLDSESETLEGASSSQTAAASTSKCEDGQTPKVISGDCSGVWSVKKTDGAANCEFEWKPTVTCPSGMTPLGLASACYGVTSRPAQGNMKTSEDCMAAYGKHPISPAYKLECCP